MKTLCLDLGSHSYKAFYNNKEYEYSSYYVHGHQDLIGSMLQSLPQGSAVQLSSPFSGPYPLNIDVIKKQLTEFLLQQIGVQPQHTHLRLALPPFTPHDILLEIDRLFLEHFNFISYYRNTQLYFAQFHPEIQQIAKDQTCIAIYDGGNQHQTVGILLFNELIQSTIRRNDCGGSYLTSQVAFELKQQQIQQLNQTMDSQVTKKILQSPFLLRDVFKNIMRLNNMNVLYIYNDHVDQKPQHDSASEFKDTTNMQYNILNIFSSGGNTNQLSSIQLLGNALEQTNQNISKMLQHVFFIGGLAQESFSARLENDFQGRYQVHVLSEPQFTCVRGMREYNDTQSRISRGEAVDSNYELTRRRFY